MIKLLSILLISSICLTQEMEVDGDLKVTGTIQSADSLQQQINSLLVLISQLEQRIAQLECQNTGIIPDGYCDCFFHTLDECGVCGGDATTCQDCAGVPNGDNLVDMCGVCDDDSSNDCVQDCFGEWGGTAVEDVCGVCGGDAIEGDACGYALGFNGNTTVQFDNPFFNYPSYEYSLTLYAKFSSQAFQENQVEFIHHSAGAEFHLATINGNLLSSTKLSSDQHWHIIDLPIPDTTNWHFIGVSLNTITNNYNLIVNNNSTSITIPFSSIWEHDYNPTFGVNKVFIGELNNVGAWNIALSYEEINFYIDSSPSGSESGLVGYWNFDEGMGITVYDQTSNDNHGTINGDAIWIPLGE